MMALLKPLTDMKDSELKAVYLMYREGDDHYTFNEIHAEFKRRDDDKLWGKDP